MLLLALEVAPCLEQEPGAALRLVDPRFDQAGGRDIVVALAYIVRRALATLVPPQYDTLPALSPHRHRVAWWIGDQLEGTPDSLASRWIASLTPRGNRIAVSDVVILGLAPAILSFE